MSLEQQITAFFSAPDYRAASAVAGQINAETRRSIMEQQSLLDAAEQAAKRDITRNRHHGNQESKEAFLAVQDALPEARAKVLDFIRAQGERGATTDEVARAFNVGANVVSGRLSELKKAMLIKDSGERRKTRSGKNAAVLVAA